MQSVFCFSWIETRFVRKHLLMEKLEKKSKTPIINGVFQIMYKNKDPKKVFEKLD